MTSFADINWLLWQRAEPEEIDGNALRAIESRMLIESDLNTVHGAIRELGRRVAALEAKQPPPVSIPSKWSGTYTPTMWGIGSNFSLSVQDPCTDQLSSN